MTTEPLQGDEARQAVGALRDYRSQILRSIHEWLTLAAPEVLFLEVAEDFDRVSTTSAVATQAARQRLATVGVTRFPGPPASPKSTPRFPGTSTDVPGRFRRKTLENQPIGII
jgi:hypothetical protein